MGRAALVTTLGGGQVSWSPDFTARQALGGALQHPDGVGVLKGAWSLPEPDPFCVCVQGSGPLIPSPPAVGQGGWPFLVGVHTSGEGWVLEDCGQRRWKGGMPHLSTAPLCTPPSARPAAGGAASLQACWEASLRTEGQEFGDNAERLGASLELFLSGPEGEARSAA